MSTVIIGVSSIGAAQTTECPEEFPPEATCHTPDPFECLSADALVQHQRDLSDCRQTADELRGRVEECRDQVVPLQRRVEEQAGEIGAMRRQRDRLKRRPKRWVVWVVGAGAVLVGGGVGWGVGSFLK